LSLTLLVGAGLLIRSFIQIARVPPGFTTGHIVTMGVSINGPAYGKDSAVTEFYRQIEARIRSLPGVAAEGVVSVLPLTGTVGWGGVGVEGFHPEPGQELQADIRLAGTDYFRTMEIPLVTGRFFSDHDTPEAQQTAIIDEKFAKRFWPHDNPIGKHVWFDPKKAFTIVGVVGVVKQYGLDTDEKIVVYLPHQQQAANGMFLTVPTSSEVGGLPNAIIREIHAVDANAPIYDVRSMQERLYGSLARQRFASSLLASFAAFALLLAAVGVYGVMSYLVTQSTHDIGVRLALGARAGSILSMIVKQGTRLAGLGIAIGLVGAIALTRVMESLLFGVSATDLATFVSVTLVLVVVALVATLIPAMRATRVDPIVALRQE
jgi:putative ABC transport system permease protein